MANSDKNITITPQRDAAGLPSIVYTGFDNNPITQNVLDDNSLSWESSAGQLFSITPSLTGTIFSVNDVSGVPSIEVEDNGLLKLAPFGGNVLVGSTSDNGAAKMQVTGNFTATGEVTAYYSDERLKDFEGTIPDALDKVKKLNGYLYTENNVARSLGYDNPNRQTGVSAQEVKAVLPEVVGPAPVDSQYLTVKYDKLVPLLIEAIKEQQTQIEKLTEIVNDLKNS
jgi:hypothetical protein